MIAPGDVRSLQTALKSQGWEVEKTASGHFKCVPPNGKPIVHVSASGDTRGWRNALSDLKRSGFREEEVKPVGNGARTNGNGKEAMLTCPACKEKSFCSTRGACVGGCRVEESVLVNAAMSAIRSAERPTLEAAFKKLIEAKQLRALAIEELNRAGALEEEARLAYVEKSNRTHEAARAVDELTRDMAERKKEFDAQLGA